MGGLGCLCDESPDPWLGGIGHDRAAGKTVYEWVVSRESAGNATGAAIEGE
jgi:hypothetical protein